MKTTDIAYIAGIVDGEGCIFVKRGTVRKDCTNPSYHAVIQIKMVDEPAINFIATLLGGNYYKESPSAKKGKPLYCFQATDNLAESVVKTILPYLRIKKRNALNLLDFRNLQKQSNRYRTKITGYRNFPNSHGIVRMVPNLAYNDEYIALCDEFWETSKRLNAVGV